MSAGAAERKLTTILSADVVGYSAMTSRDEGATIEALKRLRRELVEPKAAQYRGRTIKLMGDGALMEFASVVDAVSFAVEVQFALAAMGEGDEADRIAFRMGINVGDVIVEEDDILGDGVNIAARLEGLAPPGGICVSRAAHDHVAGKLDLDFEDLGPVSVKNIPAPIDVFRVVLNDKARALMTPLPQAAGRRRGMRRGLVAAALLAAASLAALAWWQPWETRFAAASVERMALPLPDKPSIVVLPFNDFSETPGQSYFADGMTEDLITDLSKLSGVFVISRNSSWVYKDKAVKPQVVAEEFGVRYILEGSVRRAGDTVRVNAQLIDAIGGHHLWAERYDAEIGEVFALQDELIGRIVSALAIQLAPDERALLAGAGTEDPRAYDALLHGLDLLRRGGEDDVKAAMAAFEEAAEIDPGYGRAWAGLAAANWKVVQSLWGSAAGGGFEKAWSALKSHLDRAMEQPNALAHSVAAQILSEQGRHAAAFEEIDKALALAPNDPDIHIAKARVLNATGRASEAEAAARWALRLDPKQSTAYLRELAVAQFNQRRHEESAATMRRVIAQDGTTVQDYATLIAALGHLGELDEVPDLTATYDGIAVPGFYDPLTWQEYEYWWYGDAFGYDPGYRGHLVEGLRKAGAPAGAGVDVTADEIRSLMEQAEGLYTVAGAPTIDTEDAKALFDAGAAVFVDVRAPLDFDGGHIPGATNLSLITDLSREALLKIADPETDTLVFSCHGRHCPYSAYASAKAVVWGFRNVRYYAGGFPAWAEAGLPVTKNPPG